MSDLMNDLFGRCVKVKAELNEKAILAGCHQCGKRLVEDGKPIAGTCLVRFDYPYHIPDFQFEPPSTLTIAADRPYCHECMVANGWNKIFPNTFDEDDE